MKDTSLREKTEAISFSDLNKKEKNNSKDIREAIFNLKEPFFLIQDESGPVVSTSKKALLSKDPEKDSKTLLAIVPALSPDKLGNKDFLKRYNIKYPYIAGAMANGISSVKMLIETGLAGGLGFFGSGGCSIQEIEKAIVELKKAAEEEYFSFGFNFLHHPGSQENEMKLAELYIRHDINLVSAAAFMRITPALVWYRLKGVYKDKDGRVQPKNRVIAKVSRVEIAEKFLQPAPKKIIDKLLEENKLSKEEALLGADLPMADDISAEADSGGHTDNRPALALFPAIKALRDRLIKENNFPHKPCIGLGGGIASSESAAAAFAMGADYILLGSVHQACIEAGTSELVKEMLSRCGQADVTMTIAADMFEMGVQVQVLKRETMFALRAQKLYRLYREYPSIEALPAEEIDFLEKRIFKKSVEEEWLLTREFFKAKDPSQLERAEKDPHHHMALLFKSYLGQASIWAIQGIEDRKQDFQIWCGPAMGAFNAWTEGSFLEKAENRDIKTVMYNILFGAALRSRFFILKSQYPHIGDDLNLNKPLSLDILEKIMKKP